MYLLDFHLCTLTSIWHHDIKLGLKLRLSCGREGCLRDKLRILVRNVIRQ